MRLFHITKRELWSAAKDHGSYAPESLEVEGYIHFSTARQLLGAAHRFYRGQPDLVVLAVDEEALACELRFEEADGQPFPHLYGPLNLDAVVEVANFPLKEDGSFELPTVWRAWR